MKQRSISISCLIFLFGLFVHSSAYSWEQKAHRSIALSAYQILQYDIYEIAKADDVSYREDLLRGAMDGRDMIGEMLPIHSDTQALDAIAYEIQLLRRAARINEEIHIKEAGIGSHFAYRLGVLAALVADVMHPYGIAYTSEEEGIKEKIDIDIDETIFQNKIIIMDRRPVFIASIQQYMRKNRTFFEQDKALISYEYDPKRAIDFEGYAGEATSHYYKRAVEAIVDTWYTVLSPKVNPRAVVPSAQALTWYYVQEIGYLLNQKGNIDFANRAYKVYDVINPGIVETHLKVGQHYYDFNTHESKLKGVEEWVEVQRVPGNFRTEASERLSSHYISEGDDFVTHSESADSMESDLSEALNAYGLASQYDRTNNLAAEKLSRTSQRIKVRKFEHALQRQYIDGAMIYIDAAETSKVDGDYASTLGLYNNALDMLSNVSNDFRDLKQDAKDTISSVRKSMKGAVREVINEANSLLEAADSAQLNGANQEALAAYSKAKALISGVNATGVDAQTINALIDSADLGMADTESAINREEKNKGPGSGI